MAPPRKRAVLRLLDFLVRRSAPARCVHERGRTSLVLTRVVRSAVLYVLGVACMLAMPFAARNTFMDENALLAGAGTAGFVLGEPR